MNEGIGLSNFNDLTQPFLVRAFVNSVILSASTALIGAVLGALMACAVATGNRTGSSAGSSLRPAACSPSSVG